MKYLYLIRHAKSSWSDLDVDDFDRDLNKRGKKNAPFMAKILKKKNLSIELILSSPAKRAIKTANAFSKELNVDVESLESIYEAEVEDLKIMITKKFKKHDSIAVVGHNPSLNEFLELVGIDSIDNIPTSGIVGLSFNSNELKNANLLFFEYPKKYTNS
jgi:phosphohistidine phosphatase